MDYIYHLQNQTKQSPKKTATKMGQESQIALITLHLFVQ